MTTLGGRTLPAATRTPRRRPGRVRRRPPVVFLLPTAVLLVVFGAYPLLVLVQMSFSDVGPATIIGPWDFVGLDNYADVLGGAEVWRSLLRTVAVAAVLLLSNLVLGFVVASLLSFEGRVTSLVLSVMVFIWALPPLVSGSTWRFLLDDTGLVNAVLGLVGVGPVPWLSEPRLALWSVTAVIAWGALPFSALILRGGLLAVDPQVVEAAAIDGAGYWRTQVQVVLPLLRPTLWILGILTVLYAFKSFDYFYVLTQGGPGTATNTLPVQSYYAAFTDFDMSTGATVAVVAMAVVVALAVPYVRSLRREGDA
ncbi:sugar ABC transporter permease [Pseudokineococcus basanitobsidens]|uniref:Sugar ABC transporter permease n=1 Tax=Pseudokineococcus basanitobsidens TaxID=1926649 RepID=A0ABU8RG21_9ACTN